MDHFDNIREKLREAEDNLADMGKIILRPEHRANVQYPYAAQLSSGAIVHHEWQTPFNKLLNAFLSAARSVGQIIEYRFGFDSPNRNAWLNRLDPQEVARRQAFRKQFKPTHDSFRAHPLTEQRDIAEHREGVARWQVRAKGRFGTYVGDATTRLRDTESRPPTGDGPELTFLDTPIPVFVRHTDFFWVIPQPSAHPTELPLFPTCRSYVDAAGSVIEDAVALFHSIHEGHAFTLPPT